MGRAEVRIGDIPIVLDLRASETLARLFPVTNVLRSFQAILEACKPVEFQIRSAGSDELRARPWPRKRR